MKIHLTLVRATVVSALSLAASPAATISQATPLPTGVPNRWTVGMSGTDTATFSRHVGAWSWEDDSLSPNPGDLDVGWTHTSDWAVVTLLEAATLTILLERDASVPWPSAGDPGRLAPVSSMFPSFTLWSGADADGDQLHTYTNYGNVTWAEDITYVGHMNNSTLTSIQRSWSLPAGLYTLALGSNSPATNPDRQGYRTTLFTVPEPSTSALLLCGLAVLGARRKRH